MSRILMRLAPSQAGGRLLSGIVMGGGSSSTLGTAVPSVVVMLGPFNPAVTVPQFAGGAPSKGVIVQQVTRLRTKKKLPTARRIPTVIKAICSAAGRPNLIFLK